MPSNGVHRSTRHASPPPPPSATNADAHAPSHSFASLLHPPPRTPFGKTLYSLEAAYNRFAASLKPALHLRPFRIPSDDHASANGHASPNGRRNSTDQPLVPPPNPATVFSHLTKHDTLARLRLPTDLVHDDTDTADAAADAAQGESDSAGLRYAHLQHGLSEHQVSKRRAKFGRNAFAERERESPLDKLLEQLGDPMILLLLASATVSFAIGQKDDAVSITLAIVIVVTVGWVQEQRSEKSLEALNSLVPNYCHLLRPAPPPDADAHAHANADTASVRSGASGAPPGAQSDAVGAKVLADELVPGDVVTFSTGDRIPADVRLFQTVQLEVDESTLTGEITPRKKSTKVVARWPLDQVDKRIKKQMDRERRRQQEGAQDDDQENQSHEEQQEPEEQSKDNIVFMGTMVKSGSGRGVVVGTGLNTEFGSVFSMVDDVDEKRTPLQLSMDDLAKKLTLESFCVIAVIFIVGFFQHRSLLELATIAISLAVAAIPEGLPIVVTVTLALGVLRMSKRNAIVKRLPSVETLGSVSVICSDKTGTLTENHMTVVKLYTLQDGVVEVDRHKKPTSDKELSPALARSLLVGNVCNRAVLDREGDLTGSPTEVAMIDVLSRFGWDDRRHSFHQTDEVPFDTNWKYMTVVGSLQGSAAKEEWEKQVGGFTKGAPEAILARCSHTVDKSGKTVSMTEQLLKEVEETLHKLSSEGLRVLATATGPALSKEDHDAGPEEVHKTLTFCGLHALQDPPRKGVKPAIDDLTRSGVHIVMVTGDAPTTAVGIARELGILHHSTPSPSGSGSGPGTSNGVTSSGVMTGSQVDQMSTQQLREIAPSISVFARTTPRHKMAIVSAFQEAGQVVAMTGDGVNDAPALKMADIGIAMGASGTDVAKEAADVILVDDNFVTILNAVEEGKAIFGNIQNFLAFQLSTSVAALFLILLSIMFGLALPLNAMQVLLINLACDGPPAQSLGVDPADASVFSKPPRPKNKPVLDKRVLFNTLFSASIILAGTLFVYMHETDENGVPDERDMAMTFVTFVSLDLITAVQSRGLHVGLAANSVMSITIVTSYAVLVAIIYFPPLQAIFQTIPLNLPDLLYIITLTALTFCTHGVRRSWQRKRDAQRERVPEDIA